MLLFDPSSYDPTFLDETSRSAMKELVGFFEAKGLAEMKDEYHAGTWYKDFLDFNDFLDAADELLLDLELDGVLQIASFHPQYQFADAGPDDVGNCSNRAPYPTLHLLREASIARAVQDEGVQGVICGRSIYEGTLDLRSAQDRADELSGDLDEFDDED